MKTYLLAFALPFLGLSVYAGDPAKGKAAEASPSTVYSNSDSLMKTILESNPTLRAARENYQVTLLQAGTGNTPPDPELEMGYLYGSPTELGNRVDFSVTQEVDFPTSYIHKSRIRKIRASQAELDFVIVRQEVMLLARQLWIEHVYLNQRESLLKKRLDQAETINKHFKQKLESGEVSHLAYSQSNLQLASMRSEYDQVY